MTVKVQLRRGTATAWTSANPTLSAGEIGIESDTGKIKIGNGSSSWTSLGYAAITSTDLNTTLSGYVASTTKGQANGVASLDSNALVPDAQIPSSIARDSEVLSLSGGTLTGALTLHADPTQALHAATKQYVDTAAEGLLAKPAVDVATTTNLVATYNNGTLGVNATLTIAATSSLNIDGKTSWAQYDSVLVKNQTNAFENGRYVLITVGDAETDWVFRRCGLCDEADEIPGAYIFVTDGTVNGQTGWVLHVDNPDTFVVGTDDIDVYQFSGTGTYSAGTGLTLDGTVFSVDNTVVAEVTGTQVLTNKTISDPVLRNTVYLTNTSIPTLNPTITIANGQESGYSSINLANVDVLKIWNTALQALTSSGVTLVLPSANDTLVGRETTDTLTNKTISGANNTITPGDGTISTAASGIGYMGMPQNSKSSSYTLQASDAGKHIYVGTTGQTITIPANSAVALPIGTTIVVVNGPSVSTSIAINSDTLRLANSSSTGTRTLASNGMATLLKINATEWIASGNGLT